MRELCDGYGEVLHLGVCGGGLIHLSRLSLHGVKILFNRLLAGEAAGVEAADRINARFLLGKVNVDVVAGVVLRDPLVVALVPLHVVAVLFLDELALHAEIVDEVFVGAVKNIVIDLVHPHVALLHRFLAHKAGAAGSIRIGTRRCGLRIAAVRRGVRADGVRHGLARLDERQIPVLIVAGLCVCVHIVPLGSPRAQIDLIVELVIAVFVVTVDPDQIFILRQTRINDPVRMLQINVRELAVLRHHRAVFAGTGRAQADVDLGHETVSRVVLVPEADDAGLVCANVNIAADIPPAALHVLVIARAAGHLPPAVPVAVPPVEQLVAGLYHFGPAFLLEGHGEAEAPEVDRDQAVFQRADAFHVAVGQLEHAVLVERPLDLVRIAVDAEHGLAAAFQLNVVLTRAVSCIHGDPLIVAGSIFLSDILAKGGVGLSAVLAAAGGKGEQHHQCQCKRQYLFHA